MSQASAASSTNEVWVPLSQIEWSVAALAFNVGYAGYLMPVNINADDLRRRVAAESIDRDQSYVIFEHCSPVGIVLVGRRGPASRLAALGVAPRRRRSGLGRTLLKRAVSESLGRHDLTMELEVIDSNTAALSLYEAAGFCTVDRLLGFEMRTEAIAGCSRLRRSGSERIVAALATDDVGELPWQLTGESLADSAPNWIVVSIDDGACAMVDLSRDDAVLLRLVHTPLVLRRKGSARRLVNELMLVAAGRPIRVAALIPAMYENFAQNLGFATSDIHQRRMILTPESPCKSH